MTGKPTPPQFLKNAKSGKPEFAVVPVAEYEELLDAADMAEDVAAFDASMASKEELIPSEIVDRILDGEESLVRIWREFRGLTQNQLAKLTGLHQTTISEIETARRIGKVDALTTLAKALDVELEDLIPRSAG